MGKRCVVGGCSNTHQQNVSLHKFPKDSKYHRLWVAAVKRTRKDWLGPSSQSYVCGAHFTSESFVSSYRLSAQLGIGAPTTRRLQDNAVPSIFGESISKSRDEIGTSRPVVAKLDRKRLMAGPTETGTPSKQPGPSHSGDDGPSAAVASSWDTPKNRQVVRTTLHQLTHLNDMTKMSFKGSGERTTRRLFLVQESCLLSLFKICHQCGAKLMPTFHASKGP
ncbi:putative THAP domain-containing protein 1-like [Apostichopus japonicus]|uniref:Putative THAP domain-containing protein 1-like n=1 Tax=Stichopus japonicus TaxID=307972 RepID=A0A2G8K5H1_STIJA|nr:putative THAP domain-containing protein 1-like [Apostichopus japonicus]